MEDTADFGLVTPLIQQHEVLVIVACAGGDELGRAQLFRQQDGVHIDVIGVGGDAIGYVEECPHHQSDG